MDLSIIIVSWNAKNLLYKCLASIYRYTKCINFEVFVVDNASTDGSVEMITNEFPQVKLTANNNNAGFAKANNQALEKANGKYILFLNDDTEIFGDIFFVLLNEFKSIIQHDEKLGMIGCKLLNEDKSLQPSVRKFPTLKDQIFLLTKLHNIFPGLLKKYWQHNFDYKKEQYVDQIMGSFMLTTKQILDELGSFDEGFYIWYEEVDLQKRFKQAGYKILYTPMVSCVHIGGASFSQLMSLRKQKMYNKSMMYYFKKHHGLPAHLILFILQPISLFLAGVVQLFKIKK